MADEKNKNDSCPPLKGVSVPFTTRIVRHPEVAPESEAAPRKKMPPSPGRLPNGTDIDPDRILNRDPKR